MLDFIILSGVSAVALALFYVVLTLGRHNSTRARLREIARNHKA